MHPSRRQFLCALGVTCGGVLAKAAGALPRPSISGAQAPGACERILYVDTSGSDEADGLTPGTAVQTFVEMRRRLLLDPQLTTVVLAPGAYRETLQVPRAGLTFRATAGVVIDGSGSLSALIDLSGYTDTTISGFELTNGLDTGVGITGGACHRSRIVGCVLHDLGRGVFINGADDLEITKTIVHDIRFRYGIHLRASRRALVEDCEAYRCTAKHFYGEGCPGIVFRRCSAHDGLRSGCYGFEVESLEGGPRGDGATYTQCSAARGMKYGFIVKTSAWARFESCTVEQCGSGEGGAGIYFKNATDSTVDGCAVRNCPVGFRLGPDNVNLLSCSRITILRSTIAGCAKYGLETLRKSSAGLVSDQNTWQDTVQIATLDGNTYSDLDAWHAAGFDLHGSVPPATIAPVVRTIEPIPVCEEYTPTATETASPTQTATQTATATSTPTATSTSTPTATPSATGTQTATVTMTATATRTVTSRPMNVSSVVYLPMVGS